MRGFASQNRLRRFAANVCAHRGFTLIEVLVSLIVLAFGLLASVVGIMSAIDYSLVNEMRNDAMKIAQEQEEAARNMPYANIQTIPAVQSVTRQVRKKSVPYTVNFYCPPNWVVTSGLNLGMSRLQFTVQWQYKNSITNQMKNYSYVLETIVRQTK